MSIQNAGYAILHQFFTEIQQVSQLLACQLQMRQNLFFMCFADVFNRLQFQYDFIFYYDISSEPLVKTDSAELYRDRNLALYFQAGFSKHMCKKYLVYGF